ncbi:CPBP family intramembrane glutamic endopeptidase [Runella sp.]|uniref:CPBP family intramembrane glutamic endopeptidase n=1 Tax=Runella sp. TaxID=1960881 RepID=UPI003D10D7AE
MKQIWEALRKQLREDFRWDLYVTIALFLALFITFNYSVNLEKGIIDSYYGNPLRIVGYFFLYCFAYYSGLFIWLGFTKEWQRIKNPRFWLYSLFILVVLAIDGGLYSYSQWSRTLFNGEIYSYTYRCLTNLSSALTVFLPFGLFYYFIDNQRHHFYGLQPKWTNLKPYFLLVSFMIPLIAWASFQPDFLRSYPSYFDSNADEYFGVSRWVTTLLYELFYGFDFVATELMFRGFMVIGMAHLLGRGTILPMVVCYASLHFGKPLGETIGSIFGGYILGVIALQSRSVWGGIVVHVGVAWLMDLAAWLQKI